MNRKIAALIIGLLCTTLAAETADEWLHQADVYHAAFANRKACEAYVKAYALKPGDPLILTKLTWSCNNVGEDLGNAEAERYFEQAARYAQELERIAPNSAKTYFLLAITNGNLALYRGGKEKVRLSRHIESYARKAIGLDPNYGPAYTVLGVYYREVAGLNWALRLFAKHLLGGLPDGSLEDSERMLLTAIEKDPASIYAYYQLALTYEAMKAPQKAAGAYRKVLELPIVDHEDPRFQNKSKQRLATLD